MSREPDGSEIAHPLSPGPLAGRTVIITRQKSQSAETAAALERLGAAVICCPTIETVAPFSWALVDAAIEAIDRYGWIVFTSSNGVRFFMQRLSELHRNQAALSHLIKVAIGPGTAAALNALHLPADVVATDSQAEGALAAIIEQAGGEDRIRGQRFLLPRAAIARDFLPSALRNLGAEVDDVETYATVRPNVDVDSIVQLLEQGRVDAIAFTSSSTVANFADLVGAERLPALLQGLVVGCIGPATAHTAETYGLQAVLQPDTHTIPALIDVIAHSLTPKGK